MSMSISSVGNGSGGGFDPSKMASVMASKLMKDLDPNNTGKVSKDQFVSGLTAKGVSTADATNMFDAIDTNKTGSITKSDIESAIKDGNLKPPSGGPQGGPRGAGGPLMVRGNPEGQAVPAEVAVQAKLPRPMLQPTQTRMASFLPRKQQSTLYRTHQR